MNRRSLVVAVLVVLVLVAGMAVYVLQNQTSKAASYVTQTSPSVTTPHVSKTSTPSETPSRPVASPHSPAPAQKTPPIKTSSVVSPMGIFSASGAGKETLYTHGAEFAGVLIRANWSSVEPSPGQFDFSAIDTQVHAVEAHGKEWSLAVAGGPSAPRWLTSTLGAPYVTFNFHGTNEILPLWWSSVVQTQLNALATALGKHYASDSHLALVYVTQMTSNGIEGHLQGVNMGTFTQAGYTDAVWEQAAESTARAFAVAFPRKPLAFEVHDINNSDVVPSTILTALWNDTSLAHRLGAAVWWLSGRTTYQADLLGFLKSYPGPIYAQVIAPSAQTSRFGTGGYSSVFTQAKQLGICYVEPWEQDIESGKWQATFVSFSTWAAQSCTRQ